MQSTCRFCQVSDDSDVNRTMNLGLVLTLIIDVKKLMSVMMGRSVVFYQV